MNSSEPARLINAIVTQISLLHKLTDAQSAEGELAWSRFFDLYWFAMVKYAKLFCDGPSAEDISQRVLMKLAKVLQERKYERRVHSSFRNYLKTLIRHEFIDWRRAETSRGLGRTVALEQIRPIASPETTSLMLDMEWRLATHAAAEEHVLTRMAINELEKKAYIGFVLEQRSARELARDLGVKPNYIYLAKNHIQQRIASVEALYGE